MSGAPILLGLSFPPHGILISWFCPCGLRFSSFGGFRVVGFPTHWFVFPEQAFQSVQVKDARLLIIQPQKSQDITLTHSTGKPNSILDSRWGRTDSSSGWGNAYTHVHTRRKGIDDGHIEEKLPQS